MVNWTPFNQLVAMLRGFTPELPSGMGPASMPREVSAHPRRAITTASLTSKVDIRPHLFPILVGVGEQVVVWRKNCPAGGLRFRQGARRGKIGNVVPYPLFELRKLRGESVGHTCLNLANALLSTFLLGVAEVSAQPAYRAHRLAIDEFISGAVGSTTLEEYLRNEVAPGLNPVAGVLQLAIELQQTPEQDRTARLLANTEPLILGMATLSEGGFNHLAQCWSAKTGAELAARVKQATQRRTAGNWGSFKRRPQASPPSLQFLNKAWFEICDPGTQTEAILPTAAGIEAAHKGAEESVRSTSAFRTGCGGLKAHFQGHNWVTYSVDWFASLTTLLWTDLFKPKH